MRRDSLFLSRRWLSAALLGGVLSGCAPKADDEGAEPGTGTDDPDSECNTGGDCCAINPNFCDEPVDSTTTGGVPPGSTTVTTDNPPSDDDFGDDDSCNSGGDCCHLKYCDPTGGEDVPDIGGDFLLALSLDAAPDLPLQYVAHVSQIGYEGNAAYFDFVVQPLALDEGSTTAPRRPFGDSFVVEFVAVGSDLSVEIPVGMLFAAGATNPMTGADLEMDSVTMTGSLVGLDRLCGTVTGEIVAPEPMDLTGSTFAMVRLEHPLSLPETFPVACE